MFIVVSYGRGSACYPDSPRMSTEVGQGSARVFGVLMWVVVLWEGFRVF